jgi:hypothetical protein
VLRPYASPACPQDVLASGFRGNDHKHKQTEQNAYRGYRRDEALLGRSELAAQDSLLDALMTHEGIADEEHTETREANTSDRVGPLSTCS